MIDTRFCGQRCIVASGWGIVAEMSAEGIEITWVKSINPSKADLDRGNIVPYISDFPGRNFARAADDDFRIHSSMAAAGSLNEPGRGDVIGLTIQGRLVLVAEFVDEAGTAETRSKDTISSKADEHYCVCRRARLLRSYEQEFQKARSPKMVEAVAGHCVKLATPYSI